MCMRMCHGNPRGAVIESAITNTDLSSMRCVVVLLEVEFCKRLCLLNSKFSALMLEAGCHSRCLFGFLNLFEFRIILILIGWLLFDVFIRVFFGFISVVVVCA